MDSWAEHYLDQPYKPNTRETVRRFTMRQFVAAGVAVANPDEPGRPVTSPGPAYKYPRVARVLRTYGSDEWSVAIAQWLKDVPALSQRWVPSAYMTMIPVTLPTAPDRLSPAVRTSSARSSRTFSPRYTPGGASSFLGDAGAGEPVDRRQVFAQHDHHRRPQPDADVAVLLSDRGWLVLIEAVTSHGPVNALPRPPVRPLRIIAALSS